MKSVQRICLVTREKCNREELIRIVRTPNGEVMIDSTFKMQGRGAYIKKDKSLILQAKKKNMLSRALKTSIPEALYNDLLNII